MDGSIRRDPETSLDRRFVFRHAQDRQAFKLRLAAWRVKPLSGPT
jgi:hypothetical protein